MDELLFENPFQINLTIPSPISISDASSFNEELAESFYPPKDFRSSSILEASYVHEEHAG